MCLPEASMYSPGPGNFENEVLVGEVLVTKSWCHC